MSRLRLLTLLRLAIAVHAFVVPLFYELPVPGLRLTSNDLLSALMLLSWGAWAGYRLLAREDRAPAAMALGPLFPATVVFALSHVLSTAVARDTFVAIRETTKTLGILFFLLVAQGLITDPADRRHLAWAATLGAAVASLLAIAESFSWRGGWAYLGLRPSATTGNPNTLGAYLAALLPVGFALIMGSGAKLSGASGMVGRTTRALVTSLAVLLTTLMALALLLTLSRGSWLSAVAAALAWVAVAGRSLRRGLRLRMVPGMVPGLTAAAGVILGVVVLVASVVPAPALDRAWATVAARARSLTSLESSSDEVRIVLVQASWRMFQEHPLFGVGPGNFATEVDEVAPRVVSDQDRVLLPEVTSMEFPHNWPAQIAAENGLLGLVAFTWWVGLLLVNAYRRARWQLANAGPDPHARADAALTLGAFAGIIATLVGSLFGYPFVHSVWEPFVYVMVLSGAGIRAGGSDYSCGRGLVTRELGN